MIDLKKSEIQNSKTENMKKEFDLLKRTKKFSLRLLRIISKMRVSYEFKPLVSQLVRSGTSIGANFHEADGSVTKKDFLYKISLCRKEASETVYWIELLLYLYPKNESLLSLKKEAKELLLIFSSIVRKANRE